MPFATFATIVVVYAVAALIRLAYVAQTHRDPLTRDLAKGTDMEVFDRIAQDALGGRWLMAGTAADSPLYPCVVLPAIYWLAGRDAERAAAVQGGLGALLAVIVFALARRLYGETAGVVAGALIAFYAPLVVYDTVRLGEVALNLLSAASLLALLAAADRPRWPRAAAAGLALGLAAAAKPTTLPFAAFGVAWLCWTLRRRPRRAAAIAAIVATAAGAALLPFVVRAKLLSGRWLAVRGNSGIIFLMGNNPTATGGFGYPRGEFGERFQRAIAGRPLAERDAIARRMAWEFIRSNPWRALRLTLRKAAMFLSAPELGNNLSVRRQRQVSFLGLPGFIGFGALLPLACLGLAAGGARARGRWLLLGYVLAHMAVIVAFIALGRYRLVVVPALAAFAGRGVSFLAGCAAGKRWRALALGLAGAACVWAGANREAVARTWLDLTHPNGFRTVAGDQVLIHDHSSRGTPFGVTLTSPTKMARKTLIVRGADIERASRCRLVVDGAFEAGTEWMLGVNGATHRGPTPPKNARRLLVPIDVRDLRPGANTFDFTVGRGRLRIAVDDRFDFDHSEVSCMGRWRRNGLDPDTCARYRSLWIADGELKVWLALELRPAAP